MIENKNTGQRYVGQSIHIYQRWKEHINSSNMSMRIDRAIKKHGAENFELKVICEIEQNDDLLNAMEEYYIWEYNTFEDDFHYNLTKGGEAPMRGRRHTDATKEKISKATYGFKHTPESKEKISKAMYGKNNPNYGKKGKEHPCFGSKRTLKTKQKISEARNTTGYFRVNKNKNTKCRQGFYYSYRYFDDDGKRHAISSVDIEKLEKKVKAKGLEWFKLEDDKNE